VQDFRQAGLKSGAEWKTHLDRGGQAGGIGACPTPAVTGIFDRRMGYSMGE